MFRTRLEATFIIKLIGLRWRISLLLPQFPAIKCPLKRKEMKKHPLPAIKMI